jgi:hypothetical protein
MRSRFNDNKKALDTLAEAGQVRQAKHEKGLRNLG